MHASHVSAVLPGQLIHTKTDLQDTCLLLRCSRHSFWHVAFFGICGPAEKATQDDVNVSRTETLLLHDFVRHLSIILTAQNGRPERGPQHVDSPG